MICCVVSAASCAQFPELDNRMTPELANMSPPELVPLGPLIAQAGASNAGAGTAVEDMEPRLSALRARAARLRGPVIPAPVRSRMLRGVR